MDRVAVFVDAGYLFAGGSSAIGTGTAAHRKDLSLNVPLCIQALQQHAQRLSGLPLLRIYWYDGIMPAGYSTTQLLLAGTDLVKLRGGIVNGVGQQKGVDAKIVTDMAELARNRAISDAVLIGADEDLRIGVELAQELGVKVHLVTIPSTSISVRLKQEADTTSEIGLPEMRTFLSINPSIAPAAPVAPGATPALVAGPVDYPAVVAAYLQGLTATERGDLITALQAPNASVPREHDSRLLARARDSVSRQLESVESAALRREFRTQLGV